MVSDKGVGWLEGENHLETIDIISRGEMGIEILFYEARAEKAYGPQDWSRAIANDLKRWLWVIVIMKKGNARRVISLRPLLLSSYGRLSNIHLHLY
jgi:hypothetical protein